jgi:hypothetical protein
MEASDLWTDSHQHTIWKALGKPPATSHEFFWEKCLKLPVRVSVSSLCVEVMGCVPPCYVAEIVRVLESIWINVLAFVQIRAGSGHFGSQQPSLVLVSCEIGYGLRNLRPFLFVFSSLDRTPREKWHDPLTTRCPVRCYLQSLQGERESLSVCLWPLDAEKSDSGHREKWSEKDKTTVGWRVFGIRRGPETQVLRAKCNNVGLQARADCVRPSRVPISLVY